MRRPLWKLFFTHYFFNENSAFVTLMWFKLNASREILVFSPFRVRVAKKRCFRSPGRSSHPFGILTCAKWSAWDDAFFTYGMPRGRVESPWHIINTIHTAESSLIDSWWHVVVVTHHHQSHQWLINIIPSRGEVRAFLAHWFLVDVGITCYQ